MLIFIFVSPLVCGAEQWSPKLNFSVEGLPQEQSLLFVSGLAYSLAVSERLISERGRKNFYCPAKQTVDSKLIVELLNKRLSGPQSAETVATEALNSLARQFPCR